MPTRHTTVETLSKGQLADLRALATNPRHPMVATRIRLFMALELIVATEPPRPPRLVPARKPPPRRAHALTELGWQTIKNAPPCLPAANHVAKAGWK
jgi:hypothetical protein